MINQKKGGGVAGPYYCVLPEIVRRQVMIFYHQLFFEIKRLNGAGPYYRVLPEIARRQVAIFYHRKLSHSIVIPLGIEDAEMAGMQWGKEGNSWFPPLHESS